MQDMLSQMQEKLKASSRSSNSIYSDSQTPTEFDGKKKDGIINVWLPVQVYWVSVSLFLFAVEKFFIWFLRPP